MREGPEELTPFLSFRAWNYLKFPSFLCKILHLPMGIVDTFKAVKYSRPDILFCLGGVFYNGLAIVLAGKFFDIPSVVRTAEDHYQTAQLQKKILEWLLHKWIKLPLSIWVLKNADYVLTVGVESKGYFEKKLGREVSYIVSPISDIFSDNSILKQSVRMKKALLYVGSISNTKGTQKVVEVFKKLSLQDPDWRMTFIGQNIDLKEFDDFLDCHPNATFINSLPNNELAEYYLSHSCLIFSAAVGVGYGLVTLEALKCKCPVLVINPKLDVKYLHEFQAENINDAVQMLKSENYPLTQVPTFFELGNIELQTKEFFDGIK